MATIKLCGGYIFFCLLTVNFFTFSLKQRGQLKQKSSHVIELVKKESAQS